MKKIVMSMMLGMIACSAQSDAVSDDEIRDMVVHSGFYIDNGRAAKEEFIGAKDLCAGYTNRFARILCELAQTNHLRIADRMIRCLGRHGTSAQLPFLYSMATNEQHGATAVKSILRLEGVTSNSLEVADRCLSMTNVQARMERENLCLFMLDGFANAHSNSGVRNDVERCVLCFARRSGLYNEHFDGCLSVRIPGYQFSKRRLNVLRDAERNMIIRFNKAFITNAINELVSYPEADLPE